MNKLQLNFYAIIRAQIFDCSCSKKKTVQIIGIKVAEIYINNKFKHTF